jgi:tetratricopeptide (TPR) repeat protein
MESREFGSMEEANAALAEHFGGRSIDDMPSTVRTPAERAQELAYQAYDWIGRRRVVLAKQALALWPDCAEAYVILAEHAPTPERALPLYEDAVAAGRRALGADFERFAGALWQHVEARPYMRARLGLAETLQDLGRPDEAIAQMQDLLRLNTFDNQGVRYLLLPMLLERGRRDEAGAVFEAYPDDIGATFAYCAALMEFQEAGDTELARVAIEEAIERNRFVPQFLIDPVENHVDHYAIGSEEEAIVSADEMGDAWRATPGAIEWLAREEATLRAAKRKAIRRHEKRARKRRR